MNKKGFTLIELLAVMTIVCILSIIAVPNVISIIDNNKKDTMLSDAQKLISIAKYKVNADNTIRNSNSHTFTFNELNDSKEIALDPDGGDYNTSLSMVTYSKVNDVMSYCITLVGSKRSIGRNNCILESQLFSRNSVQSN